MYLIELFSKPVIQYTILDVFYLLFAVAVVLGVIFCIVVAVQAIIRRCKLNRTIKEFNKTKENKDSE